MNEITAVSVPVANPYVVFMRIDSVRCYKAGRQSITRLLRVLNRKGWVGVASRAAEVYHCVMFYPQRLAMIQMGVG